jgi:hypothetical protein
MGRCSEADLPTEITEARCCPVRAEAPDVHGRPRRRRKIGVRKIGEKIGENRGRTEINGVSRPHCLHTIPQPARLDFRRIIDLCWLYSAQSRIHSPRFPIMPRPFSAQITTFRRHRRKVPADRMRRRVGAVGRACRAARHGGKNRKLGSESN